MNVTQEIRNSHIVYGASDYTAPQSLAASKSLNYARGASLSKPENATCTVVPHTFKYNGDVGLFGAENYFIKVKLDVVGDITFACYEEIGWECATTGRREPEEFGWSEAVMDPDGCTSIDNTFICATVQGDNLPFIQNGGYLSIDLNNVGTGNHHLDDWLDVRLYTVGREEHAYNKMYVRKNDAFYIGVHARNTRRLPFDISCIIGLEYVSYDSIEDKNLIMMEARR